MTEIETNKITRRRFLQMSTSAAATAAALALMPPALREAVAGGISGGSPLQLKRLDRIKHVVLLLQENRSFDHYFGSLSGVRGFDDPAAIQLPNGRSVFYQPDDSREDGYLLPYHLDTHYSNAQTIPSNSHVWSAQHESYNHGAMDKWISAHRQSYADTARYVMGYYKREDIPFHYALADLFTICDNYHCSVMGPTWPNRLYWMTGMIDPLGKYGGPITNYQSPDGGYRWTTYPERLEKSGVSWKVYQCEYGKAYAYNHLMGFRIFQKASKTSGLYKRGMALGPRDAFEQDAINGTLPAVSWVMPPRPQSEHPEFWPAAGAAFLASKLNAIASRPSLWEETVVILAYDENDGLFDHVRPPVPPIGTDGEFVNREPIGAGFRVPCLVVSPWTGGGWVCSERFDHTSALQFLEAWTGVKAANVTNWRRQTFGDLTSAFRFDSSTADLPRFSQTDNYLREAQIEIETLPLPRAPKDKGQRMPIQEPGARKRVPERVPEG